MPKVVVVGDANVDIIVPLSAFSQRGARRSNIRRSASREGTSANTAVALAKLGLDVSFVGTVGR